MEDTREKTCPNCGENVPEEAVFCAQCGAQIEEGVKEAEQPANAPGFFAKNKKKIILGVVGAAALLLAFFAVNAVQAANLKKELKRDWYRVEGEDGSYILCVLDFSDDEIEYRLETSYKWMDMTVDTFDYKVVSGNKIKVLRYGDKWETLTIEFNEDKTGMIISPALTSIGSSEIWVNLD